MLATLFFLCFRLNPGASYAEAVEVSEAAITATDQIQDPGERARAARMLVVWSYRETRWNPRAVGAAGEIGAMQEMPCWLRVATVQEVRAGFVAAFREALLVVQDGETICGSWGGAWRYYAGGHCKARAALVRARIELAR